MLAGVYQGDESMEEDASSGEFSDEESGEDSEADETKEMNLQSSEEKEDFKVVESFEGRHAFPEFVLSQKEEARIQKPFQVPHHQTFGHDYEGCPDKSSCDKGYRESADGGFDLQQEK